MGLRNKGIYLEVDQQTTTLKKKKEKKQNKNRWQVESVRAGNMGYEKREIPDIPHPYRWITRAYSLM